MMLEDETLSLKEIELHQALKIWSGMGRTLGISPKQLVLEPKEKKNRGVVRNYPLITKELLTDEVNLYLLMRKHIQDILAEQYV